MGKSFQEGGARPQSGFRGGNQRGGGGFRGGNQRGGNRFDQGPPGYVIPYCTFEHTCEQEIVLKVTDLNRVPKFNRGLYLENKAKVGTVDEILGAITSFYFTAKLEQGIKAASFSKGQVFYMNPEDLLPMDRFTQKSKPAPRGAGGPGGQRGGFRGGFSGGARGAPRGGGFRGAPRGGQRGGFRGAPRGRPQ